MVLRFVVPAFNAESSVGKVVSQLKSASSAAGHEAQIWVIDDGSSDGTKAAAAVDSAVVVGLPENRGKGAALRTGLRKALEEGADAVVSVDADGQHPPEEAVRLALLPVPAESLVLGIRDLAAAGAPRANRFSNRFSNVFLSVFTRRRLADTQCGLRRYPVQATLQLGAQDDGYAFEAEVLMRACHVGMPIVQEPVRVIYPRGSAHVSHFRVRRDPARIVARVLNTLVELAR